MYSCMLYGKENFIRVFCLFFRFDSNEILSPSSSSDTIGQVDTIFWDFSDEG